MKNKLLEYYIEQRKTFENQLEKVKQENDPEVIHALRLSVKRIRALYTYFWFLLDSKKSKKTLKELKVIYSPLGQIRDIQVHKSILDSFEKRLQFKFTKYRHYLTNLENKYHKELLNNISSFSLLTLEKLQKKTETIINKYTVEEIKEKAGLLFDEKLELIKNLNKIPTNKEKNLHKIRRYLKEIRYLLGIFNGYIPESNSMKVSLQRLKQIEQTLGKWHDQVNAMAFIKDYLDSDKIKDKVQKEKLKMLLHSVKSYKHELLKRTELAFKYELEIY